MDGGGGLGAWQGPSDAMHLRSSQGRCVDAAHASGFFFRPSPRQYSERTRTASSSSTAMKTGCGALIAAGTPCATTTPAATRQPRRNAGGHGRSATGWSVAGRAESKGRIGGGSARRRPGHRGGGLHDGGASSFPRSFTATAPARRPCPARWWAVGVGPTTATAPFAFELQIHY